MVAAIEQGKGSARQRGKRHMAEIMVPDNAPPGGHYSHATTGAGLLFVAGQLPIDPRHGRLIGAPFEAQAECAIANLLRALAAARSGPDRLLKVNVYVVGIDHWPAFDRIYARMIGPYRPARAVIPVPELHYGFLVEIDGIAAL
jgi:enamine deaminase RidA (YjgF/YER057c/UK114 family)